MPRVHRGCRGLATAKKELIVSNMKQKELCPFMEIIERHHTRCQKNATILEICAENTETLTSFQEDATFLVLKS